MMRIEVWMLPDCPRCHDALAVLRAADFKPSAQPIQALRSGEVQDVDAMAHLVMTDGLAPMVRVEGRFLEQEEVDALVAGTLPRELESKDEAPPDIRVNGRDLSVEEHYQVVEMEPGEIAERYGVKDPQEFVARVKAAIRYWDGVEV